jgi:ElaB/YqjD/DUF883 family membrane-anchored ribosome-binding protein
MDSVRTDQTGARPVGGSSPSSDGLVDRLMQGAHEAVDRVGAKAGPAIEKLSESAGSARDALEERAGQLVRVQDEVAGSARAYVRERPLTALAVAVLVGALAANLLRTR